MPVTIIIVQKGLNYLIFYVSFRFIYLLDGLIFYFLVIDLYTQCLSNCPVTSKWILMKSKHLQKVQFQQLINHTTDKIPSFMVHLWTKICIFQTKILSFIVGTDSLLKVLSTNKNQRSHRRTKLKQFRFYRFIFTTTVYHHLLSIYYLNSRVSSNAEAGDLNCAQSRLEQFQIVRNFPQNEDV